MPTAAETTKLHRTIWYMGAKSRVIPGFLDGVLESELDPGGTVVDLMSGSGVVSAFCADRYRVFSNDVQRYSAVIAQSLIEHSPDEKEAFLAGLDREADLDEAYERNFAQLARRYRKELRREDEFLEIFEDDGGTEDWAERYRAYLERFARLLPAEAVDESDEFDSSVARLVSPREIGRRRRNPTGVRPASLITTYYGNLYFGIRQAIAIDSLRAAIDDLDRAAPYFEQKRVHYLSALLHATSVTTSGTSHFAQPRQLRKDSELRAMAKRRLLDINEVFDQYSASISDTVAGTEFCEGNQVLGGDYRSFIDEKGRFDLPGQADLIYLDPPYTADNYSRFYHVLESVARYDYPELERDKAGTVLRGRYPVIRERFRSGFCRPSGVEDEFRFLTSTAAKSGAKLVISYSHPTGLLLKQFERKGDKDAVEAFRKLCLESYGKAEVLRRPMMHSGQGDSNIAIEELLLVCSRPR